MLPAIAVVGRPNVGKSTLFNKLTRTRDAIVDDQPGVTRDRLYGRGKHEKKLYLVVDTGGLESEESQFSKMIRDQVDQVLEEAQIIFFIVDFESGLVPQDKDIADQLRKCHQEVYIVVNKSEGTEPEMAIAEFQELALGIPMAISAKRGDGISSLLDEALKDFEEVDPEADDDTPKFALVGRPNVGKSTLTNKLVGEYRVIVSDQPGTTRDSVRIPIETEDKQYIIIDTAGVRRKSRVDEVIEKFSVIKTLQAIEEANVVLLVLDAGKEVGAQDATIAGMIQDLGRSIVVVVNKWDGLETRQRKQIRTELELKLPFLPNAEYLFISALHGSNIVDVIPAAERAYQSAMISMSTASLNRHLEAAVTKMAPPMKNNRSVRLKFAHQAGKNPPIVVVHGSQAETIQDSYRRYLSHFFSKAYKMVGTQIRIIPRQGDNPFADKKSRPKKWKLRTGRRRKL